MSDEQEQIEDLKQIAIDMRNQRDRAREERDAVHDELEETRSSAEKIIRSLSAYANRVANEVPRTIRVQGNSSKAKAGLWLAKYEKKGGGK